MEKLPVAILGATGAVGQRFVQLLENHPWFEVAELIGSSSAGHLYGDVVRWHLAGRPPKSVSDLHVKSSDSPLQSALVFSALPSAAARELEFDLAAAGHVVCTNASANRMKVDVPLLLPEANADHIRLVNVQRERRGFRGGAVIANSNCTSMPVVMSLAPLRRFGIRRVHMVSEQAISGAGYPGVASMDIIDNVIPWVSGDEGKMESEPLKMLGELSDGDVEWLPAIAAATCTRVPVIDGHLVNLSLELAEAPALDDIHAAWRNFRGPQPVPCLPSAPERPLQVFTEVDRPQIRLDRMAGKGMSTSVGRLRECPVLGYRFAALTHNTIRGAAGCSILNAELLAVQGYLGSFRPEPAMVHA
ncbi:MAG: aspartate-semialdehyde dehydrogenase [Anaerolineaceae bacterium]|nr:aspartate-semialdehyde dehydrogenase [Anaerolineaceae bacterium]